MLRITPTQPPSHSVDDVPTWMWLHDAMDAIRIVAEREMLGDDADTHPATRYYRGETRYSLTALMTVPEAIRGDGPASVTIEHYLRKGAKPTRFEMRSLGGREWAIAESSIAEMGYYEFARRGLVRVCDVPGPDGQPITVRPPRGEDGAISDLWLDNMSREHRALLDDLGLAVYRLSKGEVSRAEGNP
jgi:hypothetical protein